jgi:hypothetical protein
MNRQYLDPVFLGSYPDEMKEIFGEPGRSGRPRISSSSGESSTSSA